uniref:Putative secreted protein n=1 Tax=Anopheles marajoara TaxID=58244 RepID=A0A2M4CE81_9DIPT
MAHLLLEVMWTAVCGIFPSSCSSSQSCFKMLYRNDCFMMPTSDEAIKEDDLLYGALVERFKGCRFEYTSR